MNKIILATSNPGKINEFQAILATWSCIPQHEYAIPNAEESGLSFIENAIIKARHASQFTNKPALADDSGIVVPALQGQPGIYSARFAGPHATDKENIALLLEKLASTPTQERMAYFYCAIAFLQHACDPMPIIVTSKLAGYIALSSSGENGFGYDPIFFIPEYHCTMAELPATIKNKISHRAQALKQLQSQLN